MSWINQCIKYIPYNHNANLGPVMEPLSHTLFLSQNPNKTVSVMRGVVSSTIIYLVPLWYSIQPTTLYTSMVPEPTTNHKQTCIIINHNEQDHLKIPSRTSLLHKSTHTM